MAEVRIMTGICLVLAALTAVGQTAPSPTLTLREVYQLAEQNYPLIKDAAFIDKIEDVSLESIQRSGLPQISLNGVGQVQSENITIPLGENVLEAPTETYNLYVGVNYDLYDGGAKKAQRNIETASANVERKSLDVQLRRTKERVNNLVFAISLARKQKQILQTSRDDLDTNIATLQAGYENGVVLESEVAKLKVRQLELASEIIKTDGNIDTYFALLGQLTGRVFPRDIQIDMPKEYPPFQLNEVSRPEQELFNNQKRLFEAQESSISARTRPKISLFAQGGIGYPNPLNFADFSTAPYGLGGIKLNWNLIDFGKGNLDKQRLQLQQEQVEVDRELFLFDVNSEAKEYQEKIATLEAQIENDETIVQFQQEILDQSQVQLDNGVINSNDYVTQVNATINAEQQLEFNRIQLEQTIIDYLTLLGQL